MDLKKSKLAEKMLLFLYSLNKNVESINLNTLKRYIYLYYLTSIFLSGETDSIDIVIEKGDVETVDFESFLSELNAK